MLMSSRIRSVWRRSDALSRRYPVAFWIGWAARPFASTLPDPQRNFLPLNLRLTSALLVNDGHQDGPGLDAKGTTVSGILGTLLGSGGQRQHPNEVMNVLQDVLARNGGVQGLIARFTSAGYREHAQSWVGGDPLPVTGNQINEVFSPEEIQGWASRLRVDPDKMRVVLAEAIPQVVDHLTPNGQVPTENATAALSGLVGRLFTPH